MAQVAPAFMDLETSLARAEEAIAGAAGDGARLVVFPEAWLPGYPVWADAGIPWEDRATKQAFGRLHRNSVEVPGPATEVLRRAARRHRVHVVMGINEREARYSRGTLYNSILFLSDAGEILGVHRKLVPTHSERVIWGQGDGSALLVLDTAVGRLGGLVCWEHWMPLARFAMHAEGEQVHAALWPDLPEMHQVASRAYAFEGRTFVLSAGMFLPLDAIPEDLEVADAIRAAAATRPDHTLLFDGGSGVIGPDGEWVAGPVRGEETIVLAEIDLDRIAEEMSSLDAAGHYNRPDVFRLEVDRGSRVPLVVRGDPERGPQNSPRADGNGS